MFSKIMILLGKVYLKPTGAWPSWTFEDLALGRWKQYLTLPKIKEKYKLSGKNKHIMNKFII